MPRVVGCSEGAVEDGMLGEEEDAGAGGREVVWWVDHVVAPLPDMVACETCDARKLAERIQSCKRCSARGR